MSNPSEYENVIPRETPSERRGRKTIHTPSRLKTKLNIDDDDSASIKLDILHFNFSDELSERLTYFATLHRYDDRKAFKENWQKWIAEPEIAECIVNESSKLTQDGYSGDIIGKMFKSVRYYYRKKPMNPEPIQKKRKVYEAIGKETLEDMDRHILQRIGLAFDLTEAGPSDSNVPKSHKKALTPAESFKVYYSSVQTEDAANEAKYKKTYKNRFYIMKKIIQKM